MWKAHSTRENNDNQKFALGGKKLQEKHPNTKQCKMLQDFEQSWCVKMGSILVFL